MLEEEEEKVLDEAEEKVSACAFCCWALFVFV
jgi:hypothetical protein